MSLVLPPGHTEHTFDPTPRDVEEISAANVGVMIGLRLDPWMEKLLKDAAPTAATIKVGELVPTMTVTQDAVGGEAAHRTLPEDDHDHDKGAATTSAPPRWTRRSIAAILVTHNLWNELARERELAAIQAGDRPDAMIMAGD